MKRKKDETIETGRPAEVWAVVEVMGHSRYAGRISQDQTLGVPLLRVEVPAVGECRPFEKLLAPASIFTVTPCTEALAREAAARFQSRPFTLLELSEIGQQPRLLGAPEAWDDDGDEDDYRHPGLED